jgi:transcriptional regulator with XRE-family HTH domain
MGTAQSDGPSSANAVAPAQSDAVRRRELGAFLRSRRERITPTDAGLASVGRRRTPGLRREEVAQLAGVGATWYTWLEQARDIRASAQVISALARTLGLDSSERSHLYTLAGVPEPSPGREVGALSPSVEIMLKQLEPLPACVHNARLDILAFNTAYDRLVGGLECLPVHERNGLLLAFTRPAWRSRIVDWQDAAPRTVATFRAAMAEHLSEPHWRALVKQLLSESPDFAELWNRHDVQAPENLTKWFMTPEVGLLRLHRTHLWLSQRAQTQLVCYTPVDAEGWVKLPLLRQTAVSVA